MFPRHATAAMLFGEVSGVQQQQRGGAASFTPAPADFGTAGSLRPLAAPPSGVPLAAQTRTDSRLLEGMAVQAYPQAAARSRDYEYLILSQQQRSLPASQIDAVVAAAVLEQQNQRQREATCLIAQLRLELALKEQRDVQLLLQSQRQRLQLSRQVALWRQLQQQQRQAETGRVPSVIATRSKVDFPRKTVPSSSAKAIAETTGLFSAAEARAGRTVPSERASHNIRQDCGTTGEAVRIPTVLGTTLRCRSDPYIDASRLLGIDQEAEGVARKDSLFFPEKLYHMLQDVEHRGETDIASWLPHGRAFLVRDPDRFVQEVLPRYFSRQTKWGSFSRQLQLYGFLRVMPAGGGDGNSKKRDVGSSYHELFLRGRPDLCRYMRRVGAPHGPDRRTYKLPSGDDPDFYSMFEVSLEKQQYQQRQGDPGTPTTTTTIATTTCTESS